MRTYTILDAPHFTDGDTLWVVREWVTGDVEGVQTLARDYAGGSRVRLTDGIAKTDRGLNTPEEGKPGYKEARIDLSNWVEALGPKNLTLVEYGRDSFGRILGDLLVTRTIHVPPAPITRQLLSAVRHMRDVKGWPAFRG